ncbi:baculoviral IAP repeat-containing protein 3-like [Salvia hispanica]|uniref:baculoviral IAP repeat-containing protein 3-like n=1 Tax=Salvia hispanica TaxID=49212 RepID=UPI0020098D1D|nr:baculoviral IAP repeat-containing protein 3-like [Salvia hispanica]
MEIVGGGEKLYSQNLRDFLRIKEEDHRRNLNQSTSSSTGSSSRLTLSAILSDRIGQPPPPEVESNRTLLDVIREDQTISLGRGRGDSWRNLKDKLRLRRSRGAANRHSADSDESTRPIPLRNPRRSTESASERLEAPRRQSTAEDNGSPAEQPVRMSLMALLAENDGQMGYVMGEEESDKDVKEEIKEEIGVELEKCCVCMVRHKGAAFIPCGHTFCRLCSRELWLHRRNCPLCNNFIVEILDIF